MRRGADRGSWKNPRTSRTSPVNPSRGCDGMADPEDKKGTAGSADAKPAPKRRIRAPKAAKPTKAAKAARATQEKETKREAPAAKPGQVHVYSLDGEVIKTVELPAVFRSDVRLDLIRRAGTAFPAHPRQPHTPSPMAGRDHTARRAGEGESVARGPRLRRTMNRAQTTRT